MATEERCSTTGAGTVPIGTNVILSHHDYSATPTDEELDALVAKMVEQGADIAKIATTASDISDSLRLLKLAERAEGETNDVQAGSALACDQIRSSPQASVIDWLLRCGIKR